MMKFVVLGAGAMGRITARDLVEFASPQDEIVIADYDEARAKAFADSIKSRKVNYTQVDIRDTDSAVQKLAGCGVLINCAQYQLNLDAMKIALRLRSHYTDLGGLFHVTRKQMELNTNFEQIGRLALLGMGAAPGITNILSRWACDRLDRVNEIHTRVATVDKTKYSYLPALPVSYSLQTILEEFSMPPAVFTKGEFKFTEPMSGDEPHKFPDPVGVQRPMYTLHSEVATLPLSFADKGVKEVTFKIAFDPEFVDRVKFLRDLGLASKEEWPVGASRVKPIELVNKIAMSQKPPETKGPLKQYEVVRSVVKGFAGKSKKTIIADCHVKGMPEWDCGVDIDTGCPPAIGALMMASGEISEKGCLPPELAIEPEAFFKHLAKRKMKVTMQTKSGWGLEV